MAIYLVLLAAGFASLQNYIMRRSVGVPGATYWYLPIQLFTSLLIVILLNPVRNNSFVFDIKVASIGAGMGLVLGTMLWAINRALHFGPSGMTIAILNCYCVFPALFMFSIFGSQFGHPLNIWNGVGFILVVAGILSGASQNIRSQHFTKWFCLSLLALICHVIFSCISQWKVILENFEVSDHLLIPFKLTGSNSEWYMPAIFASAAIFQLFIMFKKRSSDHLSRSALMHGFLGGIANGCSMFFLILATENAKEWQNAVIFPIFSIAIIQAGNLIGKFVYKEKISWIPNLLCVLGIIIATVQWGNI